MTRKGGESKLPKVLVADDDRRYLEETVDDLGDSYFCLTASSPSEALAKVMRDEPDLVLLDVKFEEEDEAGLRVLSEIRHSRPLINVIMVTDAREPRTAVAAIRSGAFEFVTKDRPVDELKAVIDRALQVSNWRRQSHLLKKENLHRARQMVGASEAMNRLFMQIDTVAPVDGTVFIVGEKGVGKELVAREIHRRSARKAEEFVVADCFRLPALLAESELFGHEKGAFTDAVEQRIGCFELATKGTLFLDEIGDLDPFVQGKLLRVLEYREFRRVGGNETLTTNARFIAATNKNLAELVERGKFRADLYDRLGTICIHVPPLQDRKEDIPLLVEHFVREFSVRFDKPVQRVAEGVLPALQDQDWTGNVRELRNRIEGAVLACSDGVLKNEDFNFFGGPDKTERTGKAGPAGTGGQDSGAAAPGAGGTMPTNYLEAKLAFKKQFVESILHRADRNVTLAAEMAGVSRRNFQRMMKDAGVKA
ncbi:MAG: sigma-54-dependent Fis family transcriptional regulator [Candidatus Eisenbacteria bacterium]|nr:sigma-54-dependent Fis family transcriptional regulator [Candidatus Eisenbacteria bacterium]